MFNQRTRTPAVMMARMAANAVTMPYLYTGAKNNGMAKRNVITANTINVRSKMLWRRAEALFTKTRAKARPMNEAARRRAGRTANQNTRTLSRYSMAEQRA
jgi:hypothetical protein